MHVKKLGCWHQSEYRILFSVRCWFSSYKFSDAVRVWLGNFHYLSIFVKPDSKHCNTHRSHI
jgi:hypothetical protein